MIDLLNEVFYYLEIKAIFYTEYETGLRIRSINVSFLFSLLVRIIMI